MPENIVQSKVIIPRLNSKIVHRERLNKLLGENIDKNLIIICSPAGFGKTTLALDYAVHQENPFIWFGIPSMGIKDVTIFFEYLVYAFKKLNLNFGDKIIEFIRSSSGDRNLSKEIASVFAKLFTNEFCRYFPSEPEHGKSDVIVVIDDLHHIDVEESAEWLNKSFAGLLDNIPPNMHLILLSRKMPGFNLAHLKSKRNLFTITESELAFNLKETSALLEYTYALKFSPQDIKLLDDRLKGWISGLQLLLQAYGEDFNKIQFSGQVAPDILFDFFASEVFGNLTEELQEFLAVTSLVESFSEKLSNILLKINNSGNIINELRRRNLFISSLGKPYDARRVSTGDKEFEAIYERYKYHALFRDFLTSRLNESKDLQEIRNLKIKVGDYYVQTGDVIEGVNYYIEAGTFEKAVPIIIDNFDKIQKEGEFRTLQRWLSSIPDELVKINPKLLSLRARICFDYGLYKECISLIDSALLLVELPKNEDLIIECYHVRTRSFLYLGQVEDAINELHRIINRNLKPNNRAKVLSTLALAYAENGRYSEQSEILCEALSICTEHGITESIPGIYNGLGILNAKLGRSSIAVYYFEKCLNEIESLSVVDKISIFLNASHDYAILGMLNKSKEYFDRANRLTEEFNIMPFNGFFHHGQRALRLLLAGDFEESIKYRIMAAESNPDQANLTGNNLHIANCFYYLNEHNIALEYLTRDHGKNIDQTNYRLRSFIRETMIRLYIDSDSVSEEELLETHGSIERNSERALPLSAYCVCKYYLIKKLPDSALNYCKIFLESASQNKIVGFFPNELIKSRLVFDYALSHPELNQHKDYIKSIFDAVFERVNYNWLSEKCKARQKIEIENLTDINMNSFGRLEFRLRGNSIPESKWTRKKSKLILAYLLARPGEPVHKDKIADIFFSDVSIKKIDVTFHAALSNIRAALKPPGTIDASCPNYLIYEGQNLILNSDFYYKADCTEFEKLYKRANSENIPEKKIGLFKHAAELYRGEFLPGHYDDWIEDTRQAFSNMFIGLCEDLLKLLGENKSYEDIINYAGKLLQIDKLHEEANVNLIEAYSRTGKMRAAKETAASMMKNYTEELGEKPGKELTDKINKLLR
jgi:LuxR family transcriptional regulator, maltose regulon positive regulatory protein